MDDGGEGKPMYTASPRFHGLDPQFATPTSLDQMAHTYKPPATYKEYGEFQRFVCYLPKFVIYDSLVTRQDAYLRWLKGPDLSGILRSVVDYIAREERPGEQSAVYSGEAKERVNWREEQRVRYELRRIVGRVDKADKCLEELKERRKQVKALERRLSVLQGKYDRLYESVAASRMIRINALKSENSRLKKYLTNFIDKTAISMLCSQQADEF